LLIDGDDDARGDGDGEEGRKVGGQGPGWWVEIKFMFMGLICIDPSNRSETRLDSDSEQRVCDHFKQPQACLVNNLTL
jgi:hypothetical protein